MTERDIFISALQKDLAQRRAYLDEICADRPDLRERVEELLQHHDNAGSFLERQQVPAVTGDFTPPPDDEADGPAEGPGARIGRYKLLEQIGQGGFGVVFMAEQQVPMHRKVALKILKPGMDSGQVIARFEAERQALALMDHPNIARVLDGGQTALGRPYFVMELVKGIPITALCDREKLTTDERLRLFVDVCQAVQHAHHKGLIHRDIKPSNVLVTLHDGKPVVKVIDFGIAKAIGHQLTERTLFTGFAQMIGTPLYMSPEQAALSGIDVDTRSDVYSLGVLLYELLTGTTPFDEQRLRRAGFDEMRRIIREEEPPRPSTRLSTMGEAATPVSAQRRSDPGRLQQVLRGELDWIVMKALEKDRSRRYESPSAFAADVERYLSDEPVLAFPPSVGYRLRKFLRRRRGPVLAAGLFVLLLSGGIVGTTLGMVRAWAAEEQAVEDRNQKGKALEQEQEARRQAITERDEKEIARRQAVTERNLKEKARQEEQQQRKKYERLFRGVLLSQTLSHWMERNVAAAHETLVELRAIGRDEEQKPEDTWEYRYLDNLMSHSGQRTLRGHTDAVTSVAFSPDGKGIVSASGTAVRMIPGEVAVWDAVTGRVLHRLQGHTAGVTSVAISPDGKCIASASGESGRSGQVKMCDATTGRELWNNRAGHPQMVHCLAFSPDGRYLASGSSDGRVKLWGPKTGKELRTFAPGQERNQSPIMGVAFSPDGKQLATVAAPETVTVWETETGKELWTVQGKWLFPSNRGLFGVAFSPDGTRLAAASEDRTVKLWDARSDPPFRPLPSLQGHLRRVNSVAFSPDGRTLASASEDQTVKLWDLATGREAATFLGHTSSIAGVAFSPDGRRLASAGWDRTVKVWNVADGPGDRVLRGHRGVVTSVAFSPDSRRLVSADAPGQLSGEAHVWDVRTGRDLLNLRGHRGDINALAWSSDGKWIASGGGVIGNPGELRVWDAATGKLLHALRGHSREVAKVAFSSDGKYLASASHDQTVKLWDPVTGKERRTLRGHTGFVTGLAFRPDGKRLAGADTDRAIKLWDPESGEMVRTFKGHANVIFGLAFSPDGKQLASASVDRTVKVWDPATGREMLTLRGHFEAVMGLAFSPDGRRLASGGMDGTTRLWDAWTGQELLTLKEYTGWVTGVAFSPDGKRLASAIGDRTVKVREAPPVQPAPVFAGHDDRIVSVAFSPNGKQLASASDDQTVKLWDAVTGKELLSLPEHQHGARSVAFSADGKRLVTEDNLSNTRTWDLATGKPIPGVAEKETASSPISPDGRWIAVAEGKRIYLHRLPDAQAPEPTEGRWWIDPAPWWHVQQAGLAEQRKEGFAAAFHLATAAEHLAERDPPAATDSYNAACLLCHCMTLANRETRLDRDRRTELTRRYRERALELLRQAVARGYQDASHMKKDPDLQPLQDQEEFKKLLAELENKAKE